MSPRNPHGTKACKRLRPRAETADAAVVGEATTHEEGGIP